MSSRAKTVKSAPAGAKRVPKNGPSRSSTTDVTASDVGRPDAPVDDRQPRQRADRLDADLSVSVDDRDAPEESVEADVQRDEMSATGEGVSGETETSLANETSAVNETSTEVRAQSTADTSQDTAEDTKKPGSAEVPGNNGATADTSHMTTPDPATAGETPPSRSRRQLLFTAVIPLASIPLIAGLALLVSFVFFPEDETNPVSQAVEQQQRGPTETLAQVSHTDADGNEFDLVVKAVDPAVVAEKSANQGAGCASEIPLDYYERGLLVEVSRPAGERPVAALPRVAATGGLVAFPRDEFGCSWASADVQDRTLDAGQSTDVVGFLEPEATQRAGGELELRVGPIGDDQELTRVAFDRF